MRKFLRNFKSEYEQVAIYHCSVSVGSRGKGASSVSAAAYREGKKLTNEKTGEVHDYTHKRDVVESFNLLPDNAPSRFQNSSALWNEVEQVERRKDAQLFREVRVALPRELNHDENKKMVVEYCEKNFVSQGMIASVAFHSSKTDNPHCHIMLTMREITKNGFGQKCRQWNNRQQVDEWRKDWAETANRHLAERGHQSRIDHRTLLEQGIDRTPQIHVGATAHAMEQRGESSDRGRENRSIIERNQLKDEVSVGVAGARELFRAHQQHQRQVELDKYRAQQRKEQERLQKREQAKAKAQQEEQTQKQTQRQRGRGFSL
ncbi:MobQ family relaxase [Vibrio parahaemolyticus]|uniref:MobQ family relaxase n=1 Tax=Vibrio parahaemolyticus TaxID=670 RepID=UPI001783FBB5|nr:MobA/MobL family protein [Vibrio parahaemolyticus]